MTEKELRDRIGNILCRDRGGTIEAYLSKLRIDANDIFAYFKEAGYVRLANDQSSPEDPYNYEQECRESTAYGKAQQAMWEAGWRKVEL